MRLASVLLFLSVLASCSLDYGPGEASADQIPLMVFSELKQSGVENGALVYSVESQSAEVYASKNQMRLKDFRFREYDADGREVSTGTAEAAVIDTATNDATLSGRTAVRSTERDVDLVVEGGPSGALIWKNEARVLTSGSDSRVELNKADGSRVEARGMTLDLGSNRLELEVGVLGTWTPEADENATEIPPTSPSAVPHP